MEQKPQRKDPVVYWIQQTITYNYICIQVNFYIVRICGKKGKFTANNVKGNFAIKVVTDGKKGSRGGNCKITCTKKTNPKPTTTTKAPTTTKGKT